MILACPSCQTKYLISANLFSSGPRTVRCARCAHSWQADLPPDTDAAGPSPDANLTPPPEAVAPIPPGSNLPVIRREPMPKGLWWAVCVVLPGILSVVLLAALVLDRQAVIKIWPSLEPLYERAGLHIYHYGENLSFIGVRSELRYEGGKMLLEAEGRIHNGSLNTQQIPPVTATAMGVDGKTVQSWRIEPPAATVPAGADVEFHSTIDAPQEAVAEINLVFVETKKDDAGEQ